MIKSFCASLALAAAFAITTPLQAKTLRLSTQVSAPHPFINAAEYFKKEVEERTDGEITVRIFPNASLGKDDAVLNEVALGTVDLMLSSTNNAAKQIPEIQIFDLYYVFSGYDHFKAATAPDSPLVAYFRELAQDRQLGFRILSLFGSGSRNMSNTVRPVNSVSDVEGLKMRVPPNQVIARTWESFGTIPVTVDWPEIYAAMQTGVAQALESTLSGYAGSKLYEVVPHLAMTRHSINGSYFIMSSRTHEGLSDEHRQVVEEVAAEAGRLATESGIEADDSLAQNLAEQYGVQVSEPDTASFAQRVRPMHDEIAKTFGATELLQIVRDLE